MSKTLIRNIGCLLSGDIHEPILGADAVLIEDGVIHEIGTGLTAEDAVVYDAKGSTLMPCLIDSHVHVSIAEWAPRQSTMQYLDAYAASGITGIISAGETHVPHRPSDPEGVKALAELSHRIYSSYRPGGAKVYGGAIIPVIGLTEEDFKHLHDIGVIHAGEFGLGNAVDPETAGPMAEWGRKHGVRTMTHTGATFLAGSTGMNTERILGIKPDVICHVAGGGIPIDGMRRFLDELPNAMMEICAVNRPSPKFSQALIDMMRERNAFNRLILGETPPFPATAFSRTAYGRSWRSCAATAAWNRKCRRCGRLRQHCRLLRHHEQHHQDRLCRRHYPLRRSLSARPMRPLPTA